MKRSEMMNFDGPAGMLAREAGYRLPLQVLCSARGFYLGAANECGPVSRESEEYWSCEAEAQAALAGEEGCIGINASRRKR